MIEVSAISELKTYSGTSLVCRLPIKIHRHQLEQYLSLSNDSNPIHSPEFSQHPVIPANLLISIIPSVLQSHIQFANQIQCYTVGYRNIRFRQRIGLEDEIFLSIKIGKIKLTSGSAHVDYEFRFNTETGQMASTQGVMSDFYVPKPPADN